MVVTVVIIKSFASARVDGIEINYLVFARKQFVKDIGCPLLKTQWSEIKGD